MQLQRIFRLVRVSSRTIRSGRRARRLWFDGQLELLEDRVVPTIVFNSPQETVMNMGGPLIDTPKVEIIFWGSGWTANAANMTLQTNVVNAVQSIVAGPYLSDLTQYGTAKFPISGMATYGQSFNIANTSPPANFTAGNVAAMLTQNMANKTLPNPSTDPNLYYYVFTQPGSALAGANGAHTSTSFGGVRFPFGFGANTAAPAIVLDRLTSTFSHELVEATTDPDPGIGGREGILVMTAPGAPDELSDNITVAGVTFGPQNFDYRLNGVLVQSYWSGNTFDATAPAGAPLGACIVPTGQRQDFYVNGAGVLTVVGDQLGPNDAITLGVGANGGVFATLNGETAQFDPFSTLGRVSITSIEVDDRTGNDTINVLQTKANVPVGIGSDGNATVNIGAAGSVQQILADVGIGNMVAGATTIDVDDSADNMVRAVTIDANTIKGLAPGDITFDDAAV
jgi:hypothetical protein